MRDVSETEQRALGSACSALVDDFANALRPHQAVDPIPHLSWTVGDLGRHVLGAARSYRQALDGLRVWETFDSATENLRVLQTVPEAEPADIADALPGAMARLVAAIGDAGPAPRPWLGDVAITPGTMLNVVLADLLIHRWDLERASYRKADWILEPATAHLAAAAPMRVAEHFLTPAGEAAEITYELRIRGGSTYRLDFHGGTVAVEEQGAPDADCRLSATPQGFLLVGYGRRSVARAIVRGSLMASGRRPWLGLRFPSLVRNP